MQVLVEDDLLALIRPRLAQERDRFGEQRLLVRAPEPLPRLGQFVDPGSCRLLQQAERMALVWRLPQATQDTRDNPRDVFAVPPLPEPRPRLAPLDQQCPTLVVAAEEPYRALAVPVAERVGLVLALGLRKVDLQDSGRPVVQLHRRDVRDVREVERLAELQRPACGALADDVGQMLEPDRTVRLLAPPFEAGRDAHARRRSRHSRSPSRQCGSRGAPSRSLRRTE